MAPKMKRAASSSDSGTIYQVFLSFRGPDTRAGFTDVLYHALCDIGISVFRDNEEIRKGEKIGDEILKAIEQSRVFVPIFSKGYASSKWCLIELAKMFESMETSKGKKKILPIFYDVTVDDVKLKTKLYAGALTKHKKTGKFSTDMVRQWKEAFHGAGKIKGYELKDQGHAEFTKSFVREVSVMLKAKHTPVTDYLVQRDDQVNALMDMLDISSLDVLFVGIHGMGGIGKTTLAKVVFNKLCDRFDQSCFLADVRESSSHHKGIEKLQQQLLESVGLKSEEIKHKNEGINSILKMPRKKLLLVLDDIGHNEQVKYLAGDASWFGSGSRIIITTRDQSVLRADIQTFEAQSMKPEEALRLFSMHAFDEDSPPDDYLSLSEEAVASTGLLPLALEVIGSLLWQKRDRDYWVKIINRLKKEPHKDVQEKLMISYEALEDDARKIFLDIATFFVGHDKRYPMYMWETCGIDPEKELEELIHTSLVKVVLEFDMRRGQLKKLWMHDQLRDMGRKIARKSRIWREEEALEVVQREERNEDIEMLRIRLGSNDLEQQDIEVSVSGQYLPKLRYLECEGVEILDVKGPLPRLTWLSLRECLVGRDFWGNPSSRLRNRAALQFSTRFSPEDWEGWSQIGAITHLRVLDLRGSGVLRLPSNLSIRLTDLLLSESGIIELPDTLGKLKNLRVIAISSTRIKKLPTSIGMLNRLEELYASSCSSLAVIPSEIEGCTSLRLLDIRNSGVLRLPPDFPVSLTNLLLSSSKIDELPDSVGELENLRAINIGWTRIRKLPASIGELKRLENLHASLCSSLGEIPPEIEGCLCLRVLDISGSGVTRLPLNLPISLTNLVLSSSRIVELPDTIGKLENLRVIDINRTHIQKLPASVGVLKRLEKLDASFCSSLAEIPLEIEGCTCLRVLDIRGSCVQQLPPNLPISMTDLLLSQSKIVELHDTIGELENIRVIDISRTRIKKLHPSIGVLKRLEKLVASFCSSLVDIPPKIERCTCLRVLDVRGCGVTQLPPNLPISLTHLCLSKSEIAELPDTIGKLENLTEIDISKTRIEKLPTSIGFLKRLEKLDAMFCSSLTEIPLDIKGCTCLRVLDLRGSGVLRFPPDLPISLIDLILSQCQIVEVPETIGILENLRVIDLSQTRITKLPSSIEVLKRLEKLDAPFCSSLAEIPREIKGCTCLRVLDIRGSCVPRLPSNLPLSLTHMCLSKSEIAELPSTIGRLENLREIDISQTRIKKLPASIGVLKRLEKLDVSFCSTLAEIPPEIEGCTGLRVLDVRGCGVSLLPSNLPISLTNLCLSKSEIAELPDTIGKLENLREIDISETRIEKMPASVGTLKRLERLDASFCSSLAEIPLEI